MDIDILKAFYFVFLIYFIRPAISIRVVHNAYIIEFDQNTDNSIYQSIDNELHFYRNQYEIRQVYKSSLFKGISIQLKSISQEQLPPLSNVNHPVMHHLSQHPAVVSISSVSRLIRPQSFDGLLNYTFPYSNSVSQAYDIHRQLNITGEGILIGILDSGPFKANDHFILSKRVSLKALITLIQR